MTGRPLDTFTLDRVEVLKGPGVAAVGRRRNGRRHQLREQGRRTTGASVNEAFTSFDRQGISERDMASGGSKLIRRIGLFASTSDIRTM